MSQLLDGASQAQTTGTGTYQAEQPTEIVAPAASAINEPLGIGTLPALAILTPRGVFRTPAIFGPVLGDPAGELHLEIYRLSAPSVRVATLDNAVARTFQDWLNEPGAGSFALPNDDAGLDAIIGDGNDLVLFRYFGLAALMVILESFEKVTVAPQEEVAELATWGGRGHLAYLERGLVYPSAGVGRTPIEQDRYFNWTAIEFDDSAWIPATIIEPIRLASPYSTPTTGYPDSAAQMIWASSGTPADAPDGFCFFRRHLDGVSAVPSTGFYHVYLVADNEADLYIDGQLILHTETWITTASVVVHLTAGAHLLAIRGENYVQPLPPNPAGIAYSIYHYDAGSQTDGALYTYSDALTLIVEYPAEAPGMTVGQVMLICVAEAQARGELLGVTATFDRYVDSDGVAWPVSADIATKVGTDVLTFFREMSTYMEMWMRPGSLELSAWNLGGRGSTKPVTLEPGVNLTSLVHRGEVNPINALLVRYHLGWADRVDAASVATYGRSAGTLGLGALDSIDEVNRVADGQLALFAQPREEIEAGYEAASGEAAYQVFRPGDGLTVPRASGSISVERLLSITLDQDDSTGNIAVTLSLRDVILDADTRFAQQVKKMNDGTFLGRAKVAQPPSPFPIFNG